MHFRFVLLSLLAATPVPCQDTKLTAGRNYLVELQRADGAFPVPAHARGHAVGITALCALALLADKRHGRTVQRALAWIAAQTTTAGYDRAVAVEALCRGLPRFRGLRKVASQAVARLLADQTESGAWRDRGREETCLTALSLVALDAARTAGLRVPPAAIESGLAFLRARYVERLRGFQAETFPSPSYGASCAALAALLRFGKRDDAVIAGGLRGLRATRRAGPRDLEAKPFAGYLRGRRLLELSWHADVLRRAGSAKRRTSWFSATRRLLLPLQHSDGSWSGWFGPAYATALVLRTLSRP